MYVTTLALLLVTCYVTWQDNMLCPDGVRNLKNGEDDMNTFAYIFATPPLIHSLQWASLFSRTLCPKATGLHNVTQMVNSLIISGCYLLTRAVLT